ncbi:MAG: methylated-DNA--[protein]-cysteine S-methyltransferase [Planctomycetes bacterium]|nr:methylated-DNA--[protein]-cysteine S-methyltransferase [Planctomycetota bacterium]
MTIQDAQRIEKAILFIDEHFKDQPSLSEVANHVGLSNYHFQRLFSRWAGISPKRFLQFLTAEYARELLAESRSVLDTAYDAGLSGPGRLHDLTVNIHAATPGEIGCQGRGLLIRYGVHPSPFGSCFLAETDRGVCWLSFLESGITEIGSSKAFADLQNRWKHADLYHDQKATASLADRIFSLSEDSRKPALSLHLKGTNFQIRVWEALLRIPAGALLTYQDIAGLAGHPGATRAVGTAVGQNPISFLIPCHRVIRKTGAFGRYRWGAAKKKAIIAWEGAKIAQYKTREGL